MCLFDKSERERERELNNFVLNIFTYSRLLACLVQTEEQDL